MVVSSAGVLVGPTLLLFGFCVSVLDWKQDRSGAAVGFGDDPQPLAFRRLVTT